MTYRRWLSLILAGCCALPCGVMRAGEEEVRGLGMADTAGSLPGVVGFEMLTPKDMGGPTVDFDDLMNNSLTGATHADSRFHQLGAEGEPREIVSGAAKIEKLWPKDEKGYCKEYYDLMNAMLHRDFQAPNLQTVEETVYPALAKKEDGISEDTFRVALMQSIAIRLLLKTAWTGVPTAETMRMTDRCLGMMEGQRTRFFSGNDKLRIGGFYVAYNTSQVWHGEQRICNRDQDLIEEQSIWKSEIVEIATVSQKLLKEAGAGDPGFAEATEELAKRAEALSKGVFEDKRAR